MLEENQMGLLDTLMEVTKLAGKVANPDLIEGAMKANTEALAISQENLNLQKKVSELESELRNLKGREALAKKVYRNRDYVYKDGDPVGHCPRCWDADHMLIHLLETRNEGLHCPQCNTQFSSPLNRNPGKDDQHSIPVE
jgi:hypothetical protein